MKTPTVLSFTVAVALSGVAVAAGCSAPDPGQGAADVKGGKKPTENKTANSDAGAPGKTDASLNPDNSDDSSGKKTEQPGNGEEAEACLKQCVAANAQAKQLDDQIAECFNACGDSDKPCFVECSQKEDRLCTANKAACDAIDACSTRCFPPEPAADVPGKP